VKAIAVVLVVVLVLGLVAALAGCSTKGSVSKNKGMTTDELRERGPQPPSGQMKRGDGKAGAPAGGPSKAGG